MANAAMKAIEAHFREQNRERADRIAGVLPDVATVSWANKRSTGGPWRVQYRFAADHPWVSNTHCEDTAADLVRYMAAAFNGSEHVVIKRVYLLQELPS